MGFDCSSTFEVYDGTTSSSVLGMAPTIDLSEDYVSWIKDVLVFIIPGVFLVVLLIALVVIKCCSCGNPFKRGKIGGCKVLLFQLFFYIFALGLVALSIIAVVSSSKSKLEPSICSAQTFLSNTSTSYSNANTALQSMPTSVTGASSSTVSVSGTEYEGSIAYGIWQTTKSINAALSDAASKDSTAIGSIYSDFNTNVYPVLGTSMEYFSRASLAILIPTISSSIITTEQSAYTSILPDVVSALNSVVDTLSNDTLSTASTAAYGVILAFSIASLTFGAIGVIYFLLFVTFRGGPNHLPGTNGCLRGTGCFIKWSHFFFFFFILLLAIPLMLYAYVTGSFCNTVVDDPFGEVSKFYDELNNPKFNTCFGNSRTNSIFIDGTYSNEFTNGKSNFASLGGSSPFTSAAGTSAATVRTSLAAATSSSTSTDFKCYTCPASLFDMSTLYDTSKTPPELSECTVTSCSFASFKTSTDTLLNTLNTRYTTQFSTGTYYSDLSSDYSVATVDTFVTSIASVYASRDCSTFEPYFENVVDRVCYQSISQTMLAVNCWVAIGVLFWIVFLFLSKTLKYMKKKRNDDKFDGSASVVPV